MAGEITWSGVREGKEFVFVGDVFEEIHEPLLRLVRLLAGDDLFAAEDGGRPGV